MKTTLPPAEPFVEPFAAPPAAPAPSSPRRRWAGLLSPWMFLAPALLVFLYFKFIPMARGLQMSFYKVSFGDADEWVGLDNFVRVFTEEALRGAAGRTLLYVLVTVSLSALIALLLAQALQGQARHLRILRTAIFLPAVTSAAVVAEIWRILYAPTPAGVVNTVLGWVGLMPQGFFSDPDQALAALMGMHVWKHVPYDTVIFVAGLAGFTAAKASSDAPRSSKKRIERPSRRSVNSARGQCRGRQGVKTSCVASSCRPKIASTAARCSQAAAPVYQLQPPRPT